MKATYWIATGHRVKPLKHRKITLQPRMVMSWGDAPMKEYGAITCTVSQIPSTSLLCSELSRSDRTRIVGTDKREHLSGSSAVK